MARILSALLIGVLGVFLGLALLSARAVWSTRREVHRVRVQLAEMRVGEVQKRLESLLAADADQQEAKAVFAKLGEAAREGKIEPDEIARLRHELDEATVDFALSPEETETLLAHAKKLAD